MSSLELSAKKATVRCSEEASDQVLNDVKQMQAEWDAVQAAVSKKKAQLESRRLQLADYDDSVKRELAWMQDVEQYCARAAELCSDLAEKKCRVQQTKVYIVLQIILCDHNLFWFIGYWHQKASKGYDVFHFGALRSSG